MNIISKFKDVVTQIPGWRTDRKIIVFQSDDWGSIRMPNKQTFDSLSNAGFNINDNYNRFDSIESDEDLEKLFDVLLSYKDSKGNHPCITANCLMANPDFDAIRKLNFESYQFENVSNTLKNYNNSDTLNKYWLIGNSKKIFSLQFHGREHLNVKLWMNALKMKKTETITAFENNCFGLLTDTSSAKRKHFLAAFDCDNESEFNIHSKILAEGLQLFEQNIGFRSESFIAPNYVWSNELNETLKKCGVKYIQTQRFQIVPDVAKKYKPNFRYTGQKSKNGLIYLVRNCHFEPSENENIDWVDSCLKDIELSFFMSKPAIISTHRVNFISRIDKNNRNSSLKGLKELLNEIIKRWPEVEFLSTPELGEVISSKKFIK